MEASAKGGSAMRDEDVLDATEPHDIDDEFLKEYNVSGRWQKQ